MGFPVDYFNADSWSGHQSGGSQVDEFVCAVCCQLSEAAVYTSCTHVFCQLCLNTWLEKKESCPKCNQRLTMADVSPLRTGCPLAWRLLGRLRCQCPLRDQGCRWEGEYSELSSHLVDKQAHLSSTPTPSSASRPAAATSAGATSAGGDAGASSTANHQVGAEHSAMSPSEALNQQANQKFTHGLNREAIQLYSKAISLDQQQPKYYSNRAAAWLMSGAPAEAARDCQLAIKLDPHFKRGHLRLSQALGQEGKFSDAVTALQHACGVFPDCGELVEELTQAELREKQWHGALEAMESGDPSTALRLIQPLANDKSSPVVQVLLARVHCALGRLDCALSLGRHILKHHDIADTGALSVCSHALYLKGDFNQALNHLRQLLKLNPDDNVASSAFKRIRKVQAAVETGVALSQRREFESALDSLAQAAEADPQLREVGEDDTGGCDATTERPTSPPPSPPCLHSPLAALVHSERASALLRLKRYPECLSAADSALRFSSECRSAHQSRASALMALERFQEAERYLQQLLEWQPGDTLWRQKFEKCRFEVRKAARPDYYDLLGVPTLASGMEIKAAYKLRAREWHPDKHDSEELKTRAEEMFKLLGEGLEILSDEMKRRLYDEGYDKEGIQERYEAAQRASRETPKRSNCGSGGCC